MLHEPSMPPRRVLMTLDAVGGVWRYALDVARGLSVYDVTYLLVGFGPEPGAAQLAECKSLTKSEIVWIGEPLDWMVSDPAKLDRGTAALGSIARRWDADLLHINLPSQAAGLPRACPLVVASHSCVPTWWEAVRGTELPTDWAWQHERNRAGLRHADAVLVPSESHAAALRRVYGILPPLHVVHNASAVAAGNQAKEPFILAVGRWWDEGKNGEVLNVAAASSRWPVLLAGPLSGPDGQCVAFDNVETFGSLPHVDVLTLMQRASIFAAPSRYEPFGLAVAEAAIGGAALVLADIPTFRELWNGAALFVGAEDAEGWAHAFATLEGDLALRGQLAMQAGSRARQFSLPRQAAWLYDLYSNFASPARVT